MPLTGKQRHHLRSLAHPLVPVVQIGHDGPTPGVLAQIDEALEAHELIKVRLGGECPIPRDEAAQAIAAGARAEIVQIIGRVIVAYRRRPEKPKVALSNEPPARSRAKGSKGKRPGGRAKAKKGGRRITGNKANKPSTATRGKTARLANKAGKARGAARSSAASTPRKPGPAGQEGAASEPIDRTVWRRRESRGKVR
jgi:RNA-binding protein